MGFFEALGSLAFLQLALVAGALASVAGGVVGSYVVVKRIAFISGSISHAVLSGMGLCLWLSRTYDIPWLTPMLGAAVAAVISALLIGWIHLYYREREDSVIAAIWAVGMAVGIIFVSLTPGYNVELMSFLLGNILWVSHEDLITLSLLDGLVILLAFILHSRLVAICFDETQAKLQKVPVKALYLVLLVLVALTVVLLIEVVGIVLVLTMLTIPPTIAGLFSHRLSGMMVGAVLLGILFSLVGTLLSFYLDWPSGATIALVAGLAYLAMLPFQRTQGV
ncbi:MAG: metal ABC transporter permease [Verrucomicrobia bacterium]|nr:metal ABC transporter permease [Verrucomicrobiota bacterium]